MATFRAISWVQLSIPPSLVLFVSASPSFYTHTHTLSLFLSLSQTHTRAYAHARTHTGFEKGWWVNYDLDASEITWDEPTEAMLYPSSWGNFSFQ